MFDTKKDSLMKVTSKKAPVVTNPFVKAGMRETQKAAFATTALGNGALKYTTTGNDFVDQFAKCSAYKQPRTYAEVSRDMEVLWEQDERKSVQFLLYLRMITRQVELSDGKKTEQTQRGQGLKHEGIFRAIWLAINHPGWFWKNISLFIAAGSWKDIITILQYDLMYHGWEGRKLDWDNMGQLIMAGLENPHTSELVKKYLPQIKSNSICTTVESQADNIIAKWLCSLIVGGKKEGNDSSSYRKYRKLKSSGTAHKWQQLISKNKMLEIDFDTIHGRALAQLVSSKFLKNNKLEEKYTKWIESKPVAKYTGYVYEVFKGVYSNRHALPSNDYQKMTANKQFLQLVEAAKRGMKEGDNGLLVVVDTSGSMESPAIGVKGISAYTIAKTMALYFSYLMKGRFENTWCEFSDTTVMKQWEGATPLEKLVNDKSSYVGSTNFQSIAALFTRIKRSGIPENEFPSGILCISDGCFNSTNNVSNFDKLLEGLRKAGFSEEYVSNFKVILWDIPNGYYYGGQQAFEDFADCPNLYHISGLDPAAVAFITGVEGKTINPKNSEELFEAAMQQELLQMVS